VLASSTDRYLARVALKAGIKHPQGGLLKGGGGGLSVMQVAEGEPRREKEQTTVPLEKQTKALDGLASQEGLSGKHRPSCLRIAGLYLEMGMHSNSIDRTRVYRVFLPRRMMMFRSRCFRGNRVTLLSMFSSVETSPTAIH
jgi:hypothetical protein